MAVHHPPSGSATRATRCKRVVLWTAMLLAAGVLVNVAIAFGCARFVPTHPGQNPWTTRWVRDAVDDWDAHTRECWGAHRIMAMPRRSSSRAAAEPDPAFPPWSDWAEHLESINRSTADSAGSRAVQIFDARGWPMPALEARWDGGDPAPNPQQRWRWGIPLNANPQMIRNQVVLDDLRVMPLKPIWPGFVVNTIFHAMIIGILIAAVFAVRRRVRQRCGVCPKCTYPIGASDVCSECGNIVRPTN